MPLRDRTQALYEFDTKNEEFKQIYMNPIADVERIIYGSDDNPIAVESMPGKIERHYIDDTSDVMLRRSYDAFNGQQVYVSTQPTMKLAVVHVNSDEPGQYFLFNLETLEAKFVASPYPTIDPSDIVALTRWQLAMVRAAWLSNPPERLQQGNRGFLTDHCECSWRTLWAS